MNKKFIILVLITIGVFTSSTYSARAALVVTQSGGDIDSKIHIKETNSIVAIAGSTTLSASKLHTKLGTSTISVLYVATSSPMATRAHIKLADGSIMALKKYVNNWVIYNPQVSLFQEYFIVTNTGVSTETGMKITTTGLRAGKDTIMYPTGIVSGAPYIQFNTPLAPGDSIMFCIYLLSSDNAVPTNTFQVASSPAAAPTATTTAGGTVVPISRIFYETVLGIVNPVLEFNTISGKKYGIQYSDDGTTWWGAIPYLTASGTVIQSIDNGAPFTRSTPPYGNTRQYRVVQYP